MRRWLWRLMKRVFRQEFLRDVDHVLLPAYELRKINSHQLHELDYGFKYRP